MSLLASSGLHPYFSSRSNLGRRGEERCEVRGGARGGEMGRVEEPHLKVLFFLDSSM